MGFNLLRKHSGAIREGILHTNKKELLTPCFVLATRSGSVPFITPDMLDLREPMGAVSFTAFEDNKVDASSFLCLGNNPLVLSLRDPYTYNISSVTKQGIALLHRSGKQVIDAKLLQRMLDIFQPDIAILPAAEVPWYASNKQWSKSLSVTETLSSIPLPSVERTSLVFLPICGGQSLDRWQRSIDSCVKRIAASASEGPLQQMGISIAGLQTGESPGERETLLAEIVSKCPEAHPRAVMGLSGGPLDVLMLVKSGIDVIEGTYPLELATLGEALSFATEMGEGMGGEEGVAGKDGWKINLHDGIHRHANVPLVEGCDCYACRTHTRAYIHHLLVASEMLGETLLALHNISHYTRFLDQIRQQLANLPNYEHFIRKQL